MGATALEHRGAFENYRRSSYLMDEPKTNAQTSKIAPETWFTNVRAFEIFLLLYHGLNSEVLKVISIKINET